MGGKNCKCLTFSFFHHGKGGQNLTLPFLSITSNMQTKDFMLTRK